MTARTPFHGILGQIAGAAGALAVTAALVFLPVGLGYTVPWGWVGAGALGWMLALVLRLPVILGARRLGAGSDVLRRWTPALAGPAEELVRLGVVLMASQDFATAYAIGAGWAAVEAVYGIPAGIARLTLMRRDDPKALEARRELAEMGLDRDIAPAWGMVERLFAGAAHIGFTLLVARWPPLVIVLIPLHAAVNMGVMALLPRGIARTEALVALAGIALFLGGLAAFGVLGGA